MATTTLTLDDFPLIGTTPAGGRAKVTGLPRWLSRSVRRERTQRTGQHGSFSSPGLGDVIDDSITALVTYPDAASCAQERLVIEALGGYDAVQLVVTDAAGSLVRAVEVDHVDVTPINDRVLQVVIDVTATDPFKRATTATTTPLAASSTVSIASSGTAAADLRVTVTSAGTVVLSAGGLTLTTTTLPVGAVIDTGAATITALDGSDLFSAVPVTVSPQWPALPAGGGPVTQAGTAALSIEHHDTYA